MSIWSIHHSAAQPQLLLYNHEGMLDAQFPERARQVMMVSDVDSGVDTPHGPDGVILQKLSLHMRFEIIQIAHLVVHFDHPNRTASLGTSNVIYLSWPTLERLVFGSLNVSVGTIDTVIRSPGLWQRCAEAVHFRSVPVHRQAQLMFVTSST
jgi:hypothetical protein